VLMAVGPGLNIVGRDCAWSEIDRSAANKSYARSLGHAVDACEGERRANCGIATNENESKRAFIES
jgi:hypothetical protein